MPKAYIVDNNIEDLPLSEAVLAGDFLFVSGMVGFDNAGGIVPGGVAAETTQIMEDLDTILQKVGATLEDVVKTNVFLTDAEDFTEFNETYAKYFKTNYPARVGVVVALTIDARVEMDFVAYIDPSRE